MDCYKTIGQSASAETKEKGSRFLAWAYRVDNADDVRRIVLSLKAEHHAARHHCYAYRIGVTGENVRANDDGEPSGTAGRPILGQIISRELSDVLVVVVRYFGGTLLGVSGLIAAYKEAASEVLDRVVVVENIVKEEIEITIDYSLLDKVLRCVRLAEAEVVDMGSDEDRCVVRIAVRQSLKAKLEEDIDKLLRF